METVFLNTKNLITKQLMELSPQIKITGAAFNEINRYLGILQKILVKALASQRLHSRVPPYCFYEIANKIFVGGMRDYVNSTISNTKSTKSKKAAVSRLVAYLCFELVRVAADNAIDRSGTPVTSIKMSDINDALKYDRDLNETIQNIQLVEKLLKFLENY